MESKYFSHHTRLLLKFYVVCVVFSLAAININLVGVDPSDILIPSLLVIGLALGYLKINELRFPLVLWFFFVVFVFFYLCSMIVGGYVVPFVAHLTSNIAFLCFLKLYVDSEKRMRQVLLAMLTGAIITSIIAIAFFFDYLSPRAYFFDVIRSFRYMSLIGDPNILAIHTMLIVLWLFDEIMVPKLLRVPRWISAALLILALVQIVATQSRSGWLGLLVALSCYFLWDLVGRRLKKALMLWTFVVVVLSSAISLLFMAGLADVLSGRLDSLTSHSSQAEEERFGFVFTRMAIDLAFEYPLGVGPGITSHALGLTSSDGDFIGAHNSYIQILSDNGWGAFIAFFAMLMVVCRSLIAKMTINGVRYGVSYQFLFSGLAGLAAAGMFQDLIEWQTAWILPSLVTIVVWPTRKAFMNDLYFGRRYTKINY